MTAYKVFHTITLGLIFS